MNKTNSGLKVVFHTERLTIRTADQGDVGLVYELWTNPEVMRMVGFPNGLPLTHGEIEARLKQQPESEFERLLVVMLKESDLAIGECLMHRPDEAGIAEPDVKLLPAFWGSGYGVEVWEGLIAYLFDHTECNAVQSTPNVENVASIRMMEKVGGVRIGEAVYEFPESMQAFTNAVHCYIYRVKRAEWPPRRR